MMLKRAVALVAVASAAPYLEGLERPSHDIVKPVGMSNGRQFYIGKIGNWFGDGLHNVGNDEENVPGTGGSGCTYNCRENKDIELKGAVPRVGQDALESAVHMVDHGDMGYGGMPLNGVFNEDVEHGGFEEPVHDVVEEPVNGVYEGALSGVDSVVADDAVADQLVANNAVAVNG